MGKNKKKRHVYPDVPEVLPFPIVDNHTHLPVRGDRDYDFGIDPEEGNGKPMGLSADVTAHRR